MTIGDFERRFMDHTPVLMDVRAHSTRGTSTA